MPNYRMRWIKRGGYGSSCEFVFYLAMVEAKKETPVVVVARPKWVLLHVEAAIRGFTLKGFRRWLKTRKVFVKRDLGRLWVMPEAVDRAIEAA